MKMQTILEKSLPAALIACILVLMVSTAQGTEPPFPVYGSGPIKVHIYTDYFCPPCRATEPSVEPILKELIRHNRIQLTLVDVPLKRISALYARYFLYALKAENSFGQAIKVRSVLFSAAAGQQILTKEKIEELFKSKGIPFMPFEPRSAFAQYNSLIKDDGINATPSCVLVRDGGKEKHIGGAEIIKALRQLK